ncbi:MAG: membrane protein insertion efficiency factor YidD [bacterium]
MNKAKWILFMAMFVLCYSMIVFAESPDIQTDWQPWDIKITPISQKQKALKYPTLFIIVKALPLGAIIIYQRIISPQQGGVCNFTPSCSQFSLQAIKKYGISKGILMTSDRLQRCHYCVSGEYSVTPGNRFYDPVKNHCLGEDLRCLEYGYVEKNAVIVPHSL